MGARLGAWTALLAVSWAADMASDYFLRARLLVQQGHTLTQLHAAGLHPESWDAATSCGMFLGFVGLGVELGRSFFPATKEIR